MVNQFSQIIIKKKNYGTCFQLHGVVFPLQFSDPVLISTDSYTVPKSSKASTLPGSANVRFYGEDLCVAVTKITEVERLDGTIDRSSVCQKSCFGVGGGDSLDTYSGTFGRPMDTDPLCCYYGRTDTLRFSIPTPPTLPPPSYECMKCFDCDAPGAKSSIQTCDPGDKCFTVKLQHLKKENNLTTIKGCSHRLQHWGEDLYCDYQCEYNVPLWDVPGPYIYYKICVSCCSGNKCNVNKAAPGAGSRGHMHTLFITVLFSVFAAI